VPDTRPTARVRKTIDPSRSGKGGLPGDGQAASDICDLIQEMNLIPHANRDHEGRLEYIGAVQDVTQRRMSEEVLAKARSELAKVAA
jgi:hypothetical protein